VTAPLSVPDLSVSPPSVPSHEVASVGESPSSPIADRDRITTILSGLNDAITAGHHRLDPMLGAIAVAAQDVTGASGAAIAMWKDGAVVCRARSGETAPPLGVRLSAESGISGTCLRTGEMQLCSDAENDVRVDAEVCRHLGVQSIAVLPIQGWRGINGILEVFAPNLRAFTEDHIAILRRLAALAERARAAQPQGASAPAATEDIQDGELSAAPSGAGDIARVVMGSRRRQFVIAGLSLFGIGLLGFAIWLGWHTPDEKSGEKQASVPTPSGEGQRVLEDNSTVNVRPSTDAEGRPPVRTEDPVKLASRVDVISGLKQAPLLAKPSAGVVIRREPFIEPKEASGFPKIETSIKVGPAPALAANANLSALNGASETLASTPPASPAKVSPGITPGYVLERVPAVYPQPALMAHLQGKVVIQAEIAEDGSMQNLKVVEGDAALARAATDAVRHWRYKPYELDGKPVRMPATVVVNFKLP